MIGNFPAGFSGLYRMVRKYRRAVGLFTQTEGPPVPFAQKVESLKMSDHPVRQMTE
jgi:hypothetical protein